MTLERAKEIEFIRSELIGPARSGLTMINRKEGDDRVEFDNDKNFTYPSKALPGLGMPVFWRSNPNSFWQEIIHFGNENPLNRYGAGLLHPAGVKNEIAQVQSQLLDETEVPPPETVNEVVTSVIDESAEREEDDDTKAPTFEADDDFEISNDDVFKPSTMGISFCLKGHQGELKVFLPPSKKFFWQPMNDEPFLINGSYEKCTKLVRTDSGVQSYSAWRRIPVTDEGSHVNVKISDFQNRKKLSLEIPLVKGTGLRLKAEIFPRKINGQWIVTVVIRNPVDSSVLRTNEKLITSTLFQTYFEVSLTGNSFAKYPEGTRPFDQYDKDEQTLALLYRDSATWAIGHGCAAGWESDLGQTPDVLFADIMPATELPSMTPDIQDENGNPIKISMYALSNLDSKDDEGWDSLNSLSKLYKEWIDKQADSAKFIDAKYRQIASEHLDACRKCLYRIDEGIKLLQENTDVRRAFELANQSMLLQQIASKNLKKRALRWNGDEVFPEDFDNREQNPYQILQSNSFHHVGTWRAFQIAFLLMSIEGLVNEKECEERELVDLIWFPTGGGKTEAYLAVAAFYMFYQRLKMVGDKDEPRRDGTNVFMRYTLRMLTTQQFQRAASLICAMEFIRCQGEQSALGDKRFSLGLWIGGDGAPNSCKEAITKLNRFKRGDLEGNPLVLTECPWCRSEIGALDEIPKGVSKNDWIKGLCAAGFEFENKNEPVLKCSDPNCHFGQEYATLPIEVIDERLYRNPPSMFIGTVDKFAMLAFKPEAGALFGKQKRVDGKTTQVNFPPGLIIQDELHLISGPLGTMYGAYEGVFEALCTYVTNEGKEIKPKIIASTATIRGADEQVKSIYARNKLQLFPSPGLLMKDSFFGRYAENDKGKLKPGRLYLGIHAYGYGSFLTTQVRLFTAALFRSSFFEGNKKDPWWTLLAFYNSIRELGGARTLFSSDIAARLKNYFYRYGEKPIRYVDKVEELTSRKTQAALVHMMDRLATDWNEPGALDACLSSNIIEVGVDIDRLSLMAVVGQPKSTAQYIQVTGRVGRKWWERPGLIMAMFNPAKSRDRSHFEQFQSYHRRLYERVEPTSATPFSVDTVERAAIGAILLWARQFYAPETPNGEIQNFEKLLQEGKELLIKRCRLIITDRSDLERSISAIEAAHDKLVRKWTKEPMKWSGYPQKPDEEYLMLWPGQAATHVQKLKGELIPSSMRNVDASARLKISSSYFIKADLEAFENEQ